jgi:hypothetical protein
MEPPVPDPAERLLTVVEAVAARAEEARRRLDDLSAMLDDLAGRLDAHDEAAVEGSQDLTGPTGPMRLAALELAVAGAGRAETAEHLRTRFPGADATEVLDDVFGPA